MQTCGVDAIHRAFQRAKASEVATGVSVRTTYTRGCACACARRHAGAGAGASRRARGRIPGGGDAGSQPCVRWTWLAWHSKSREESHGR